MFPTVQMALAVIKVVPKTGRDVHEQGKMQSIVDLMSEQVETAITGARSLEEYPCKVDGRASRNPRSAG